MKTCTKCGTSKPLSAFARRRTVSGTLQSWCRDCHRVHAARRYARFTPEQIAGKNATTRRLKRANREKLWAYLAGHRCVDCGERDVVVLDLDHRGTKRDNVSDLISNGAPWSVIEAEIAGCEVRCANCHKRKTAARRSEAANGTVLTRKTKRRRSGSTTQQLDLPVRSTEVDSVDLLSCQKCHEVLPAAAFAWRSKEHGIRQPWCRSCHNAHKRSTYGLDPSREIARTTARRRRLLAENAPRLHDHLADHPCVDCGESDPVVLEFDHLRDKRCDVTQMLWSGFLWSQIELEIMKCEVRCANCHRRRTARQRGFDQRKRARSLPRELRPRTDSNRRLLRP